MSGTTNIESSVEGKPIRRAAAKLLLLDSNQDQRFQRPVCCRYTKEECARTHRTRMPDCVPPCRSNPFFAGRIPGPIPWPITADRLADGARVELARDFRPNSLSRTAPLPHGPPSMPVFAIQGHTGQTSINPSWERFSCGGSRSREDSNLRGLAPLLLSEQSHSTALPPLHRSTRRNKLVDVFVRISCSRWDSNPRP